MPALRHGRLPCQPPPPCPRRGGPRGRCTLCARTPVPAATPERSKVLAFPHPRLWAPGSATRAGRAGAVPRGGRCLEAEGFEEPMLLRFRPLPSSHRLHLPQPSAFPPLPFHLRAFALPPPCCPAAHGRHWPTTSRDVAGSRALSTARRRPQHIRAPLDSGRNTPRTAPGSWDAMSGRTEPSGCSLRQPSPKSVRVSLPTLLFSPLRSRFSITLPAANPSCPAWLRAVLGGER